MAYCRGPFGIEFTPRKPDPDSHWQKYALIATAAIAAVSLLVYRWARHQEHDEDAKEEVGAAMVEAITKPVLPVAEPPPSRPPPEPLKVDGSVRRPQAISTLLMRLDTAEKLGRDELAAQTIEKLRATPGAEDLDDRLARRLGEINIRRLFGPNNSRWVTDVTVRSGDTATRIARENGCTLAILSQLNGNVDRLQPGKKLRVLRHPDFTLAIHRRSRTADLSLDGKFFKRYYLQGDVKAAAGAYSMPDRTRPFWTSMGIALTPDDRKELEKLLPKGIAVLVSDI